MDRRPGREQTIFKVTIEFPVKYTAFVVTLIISSKQIVAGLRFARSSKVALLPD
jgi:hypothetical protein